MIEADKLTPTNPINSETNLVEATNVANTLDLRRDGYGRPFGAPGDSQVHLRDYWRIIRRRLWIPISVVLLVVTLTTISMLRTPSIYQGKTTIQIDREDSANLQSNTKEFRIIDPEDWQYINTQLKNLQSPTMAYKVVKTLDLEHNPKFITKKPGEEKQETLTTSDDIQADRNRLEPMVGMLLGGATMTRLRDTRLVEIAYQHTDRELAKKITDTWAEVFISENLTTRKKGNRETADFLEEQVSQVRLDLRQSEEKLMNYRRNKQVIDFGESEKGNITISRLSDLNSQLLQAQNDRKSLETFYELSKRLTDLGTLPEIQMDPQVQEINRKMTELKDTKAKLDVEYTPEWPAVQQVAQQISQLENERRAAYKRIQASLENRFHAAVEKERSLTAAFAAQKGDTVQQQESAINSRMLQSTVDTNRDLLKKLMESKADVSVGGSGIKPNIRVTDYSALPRSPIGPKRTQNILLSLLLSLVGGIGLALFVDYINNKIESVEDIDRYLQVPVLGVIPIFPGEGKERQRVIGDSNKQLESAQVGLGLSKKTIPVKVSSSLIEIDNSSSIAESYRQLRTAVLLSSASHAPRTILVTSSQPSEGKTTTSTNLAISLSQTGASVLIVDCDLRRPRLHKVFGVKNSRGLSNYLSGTGELASLVQPALPNLFVLPVGPLPPNPAELLGSVRMKQTVELLQNSFDYVILDSPPVASFADSLILSAMVEGVILVVKAGFTSREVATRTKAHLQTVGAKILGVVINHIKLQPHDYYYYSTYYSRYYYRDEASEAKGNE